MHVLHIIIAFENDSFEKDMLINKCRLFNEHNISAICLVTMHKNLMHGIISSYSNAFVPLSLYIYTYTIQQYKY